MEDELPSEVMKEIALRLRRLAIAEPRALPIAEDLERITEKQEIYEKENK